MQLVTYKTVRSYGARKSLSGKIDPTQVFLPEWALQGKNKNIVTLLKVHLETAVYFDM